MSSGDDLIVLTNEMLRGGGPPHDEVSILDDGRRIETAEDVRALVAEFLARQAAETVPASER